LERFYSQLLLMGDKKDLALVERNAIIYHRYNEGGVSFASLGAAFGISASRVREIFFKLDRTYSSKQFRGLGHEACAHLASSSLVYELLSSI
jgi:hypothetical protein